MIGHRETHSRRYRSRTAAGFYWIAALFAAASLVSAQAIPPEFLEGIKHVRAGRYRQALGVSDALKKTSSESPFGDAIAVETYWSYIYCETGHVNGSEVWNLVDAKTSGYDRQFQAAVDGATRLSSAMKKKKETRAWGTLLAGFVYAAQSRLHAFREQTLASAADAKRMRTELVEAAKLDTALLPETNVGLGSYDYYADALSPLLKFFRFILGIPGGDKARGIQSLRDSSSRAVYWQDTATFELARILGVREGRHAEALPLMRQLMDRYPENALYALAAAFEAEGSGDRKTALDLASKARESAEKMEPVCKARFTQASEAAVKRLAGPAK